MFNESIPNKIAGNKSLDENLVNGAFNLWQNLLSDYSKIGFVREKRGTVHLTQAVL